MKNNRGITLASLIILIIIVFIVAGISVSTVYNQDLKNKTKQLEQMNDDAINQAEENEKNTLKQNIKNFTVTD